MCLISHGSENGTSTNARAMRKGRPIISHSLALHYRRRFSAQSPDHPRHIIDHSWRATSSSGLSVARRGTPDRCRKSLTASPALPSVDRSLHCLFAGIMTQGSAGAAEVGLRTIRRYSRFMRRSLCPATNRDAQTPPRCSRWKAPSLTSVVCRLRITRNRSPAGAGQDLIAARAGIHASADRTAPAPRGRHAKRCLNFIDGNEFTPV